MTLHFGFTNTIVAVVVAAVIIFAAGVPICFFAAEYGVDIDLLTRGAGFGYIGSTSTSLIYASFTFILFAIERRSWPSRSSYVSACRFRWVTCSARSP